MAAFMPSLSNDEQIRIMTLVKDGMSIEEALEQAKRTHVEEELSQAEKQKANLAQGPAVKRKGSLLSGLKQTVNSKVQNESGTCVVCGKMADSGVTRACRVCAAIYCGKCKKEHMTKTDNAKLPKRRRWICHNEECTSRDVDGQVISARQEAAAKVEAAKKAKEAANKEALARRAAAAEGPTPAPDPVVEEKPRPPPPEVLAEPVTVLLQCNQESSRFDFAPDAESDPYGSTNEAGQQCRVLPSSDATPHNFASASDAGSFGMRAVGAFEGLALHAVRVWKGTVTCTLAGVINAQQIYVKASFSVNNEAATVTPVSAEVVMGASSIALVTVAGPAPQETSFPAALDMPPVDTSAAAGAGEDDADSIASSDASSDEGEGQ